MRLSIYEEQLQIENGILKTDFQFLTPKDSSKYLVLLLSAPSHRTAFVRWLFILLTLMFFSQVRAVDITMPVTGYDTVSLTPGVSYRVFDPGGTANYPNNCSSHLILQAPAGYLIAMQGELYLATSSGGGGGWGNNNNGGDTLTVYRTSVASNATRYISYSTSCTCLLTVNTNAAHLAFSSNNSGQSSGFELTVRLVQLPDEGFCFNYLDLQNDGQASYGIFTNPSANQGCAAGRHEVVYWDELDPNTNNLLHRIPEGESYSVRLGNDLPGGQAERIAYPYFVDTSEVQLLILKYAAVLEAPNHSAERNPKFTFRILDQSGNDVDANCYSATFIADASLGWNTCTPSGSSTTVYWKDWTTVGVDLSGLDRQNITIELTTYDCNPQQTGHYGYAYFTLGCADKVIHTTACGDFDGDTLTAPSGFNYSWYNTASPNQTLGTGQQLVVTTPGIYGCHLNFIGDNTQTCQFELSALVSSVYTFARFSSDFDSSEFGPREVCFQNLSGIASVNNVNNIDPSRSYSCFWDFGDGTTSTELSPCHFFAMGEYDVTLTVNEVGRECYDTATLHLNISDLRQLFLTDTICQGDEYVFFDSILTVSGLYLYTCDTMMTQLQLAVMPTHEVVDGREIVENNLPYRWEGITITGDIDTAVVLHTQYGCDSLVHLSVHVFYNTHSEFDTTLCSSMLPWEWNGVTFTGECRREVVLQGTHGEDSVVAMTLHVIDSYTEDLYFRSCDKVPVLYENETFTQSGVYPMNYVARNGCDSVVHIHVAIEEVPAIEIGANPPFASLTNPTIQLSSQGGGASQWQWWIDGMPLSTDCNTHFCFSMDEDSVEVCLMAASASGCVDTGCIIIPFYKGIVWVPNAFTPDMPTNNTFFVKTNQVLEAHLWIYTRSGLLVTDFDALTGSWDGTHQGVVCPQGSYVWKLQYTTLDQPRNPQKKTGSVLLLR